MPPTNFASGSTAQYPHLTPSSNRIPPQPNAIPMNAQAPIPVKKRKHVWMDLSDVEADETSSKNVNGITSLSNGKRSPQNGSPGKHKKTAGLGGEKLFTLQQQRAQLPIAQGKDALVQQIIDNDTVIILGETGSGKTTQIPQYVLESGISRQGIIAVTQPRKVAATSLASRVAAEQNVPVGGLVGYSVRFDEVSSGETRIKYMTDGMLVREFLSDPTLSRYSVVVVDEAHERTLRTDVVMLNLKAIQQARSHGNGEGNGKSKGPLNPLKIVIMSATLDAEKFSRYYDNAKVLYVKGRQHPVKIFHTATSQLDYVDAALRTFFQIHIDQPPGDVLLFLPGQEDIESLEKSIKLLADQLPKERMRVLVCPMYAALPPGQQAKVFAPTPLNTRKCILATNIAETSITIPGIKYVVDTGKCKERNYIARETGSGIDTLLTKDITKSSAMQRAGRAGREGKGYCFRLYTEADYEAMEVSAKPEIQRCSLTSAALQLRCLKLNIEQLDFMDKPDQQALISALKTLYILEALDVNKALTNLGRQMVLFPLEPPHARAIIASKELACTSEVIDIVSVLSASSVLFFDTTEQRDAALEARRKFRHSSGDHMTTLNAFRAYQEMAAAAKGSKAERKDWCRKQFLNERTLVEAMAIRNQLRMSCERAGIDWRISCGDSDEPVLKSLLRGLPQNTAQIHPDGTYKQIMGLSTVKIHPASSLCDSRVAAIFYDELVFTTHKYVRGVSTVPRAFLMELPVFNIRIAR